MEKISMDALKPGETGQVIHMNLVGAIGARALDLGLMDGTHVRCVHASPSGDPKAYSIRGAIIAMRKADLLQVEVERCD